MKTALQLLESCALALVLCTACTTPDYSRKLPDGWPALLALKPGEARPNFREEWEARDEILPALERSIEWTKKPSAAQFFPIEGVSQQRALASLERFRDLLKNSSDGRDFNGAIGVEFEIYKSAGWNGKGGGVLFTGYCTPILDGNLTADATYRYPLYGLPDDLVKGKDGAILGQRTASGAVAAYPDRHAIEAGGLLKNKKLELVYLKDPLDAFIAHVNGSAVIRLPNGQEKRFGYAGKNGQPYTSLGGELVKDKQLKASEVSLPAIREWGRKNPDLLQEYLERDKSFVFFLPIDGNPKGSLNVEVAAGRTLATDKTLFPRGAIVFIDCKLPMQSGSRRYDRFLFDQDTGGAIRTAGRADIYFGVGDQAEEIAGHTKAEGQMYYLFLKDARAGQP
jgi:membrane-bound lytic murein transglycosylase A